MEPNQPHVIVEDETLRAGFTQIPNLVLRRPGLPPGAKLTYMVLLSYAWQKDSAYPGQDRLAADMGVSERSVVTYLKQLVESGLVTIRRRGLGMTNVYVLHRLARSEKSAPPEVQDATPPQVQNLPHKNTQLKKTQGEEDLSNDSTDLPIMSKEDGERIAWLMTDIARELHDQAPLKSTLTRTTARYAASGMELPEFLDLMQAAKMRTQRYSGNIRTEGESRDGWTQKNKVPYFFRVLESLIEGINGVQSSA